MYLKAKSYKLVFKYDLINTLKYIHDNDIKVRGKTGKDIERLAMIASKNNSVNVLIYLINELQLDIRFDEDHILKDALFYGYHDMIKLSIDHGANIQNCSSSFIDSCIIGNYEITEYMFNKGFHITYEGNESIVAVCEHGHLKQLKLLLENGVKIDKSVYESLKEYSDKECLEYLQGYINQTLNFFS